MRKRNKKLMAFEICMFLCLLTILLTAFRITDLVGFSWWWVLAPLWVPTALMVLIVACSVLWYLWNRRSIESANGLVHRSTNLTEENV